MRYTVFILFITKFESLKSLFSKVMFIFRHNSTKPIRVQKLVNRSRFEMPFGELTCVDPRNHVLDGRGQDRTNPFADARGGKTAMGPFAKLFWILVNQAYHSELTILLRY